MPLSELAASTMTEKDVEAEVIDILTLRQVIVLKASVKIRSKNPRHHQTGQSPGIPDLLIRRPWWPAGALIGLELKRPKGWAWSCPEQRRIHEMGGSFLVHCAEDAIEVLEFLDKGFRERGYGD